MQLETNCQKCGFLTTHIYHFNRIDGSKIVYTDECLGTPSPTNHPHTDEKQIDIATWEKWCKTYSEEPTL